MLYPTGLRGLLARSGAHRDPGGQRGYGAPRSTLRAASAGHPEARSALAR
jgi:hypothetical protein